MAEALCGPSDALHSFSKHASVDRTLQQDRLSAFRQSPGHAFRSSPSSQPSAQLETEFEAFQAGRPFDEAPSFGRPHEHFAEPAKPQLPAWAADFRQLDANHHNYAPLSASQFKQEAPLLQRGSPAPWHQEFVRQGTAPATAGPAGSQRYQPWLSHSQMQPHLGLGAQGGYVAPVAGHGQRGLHVDDMFDDAAFARAFDAAGMELGEPLSMGKEALGHTSLDTSQPRFDMGLACTDPPDVTGEFDFATFEPHPLGAEPFDLAERIGSDTIPAERSEGREGIDPEAEADELAMTAGRLLDGLKHEQSQKFQNSSFLALMRQLRDKEVRVEGDSVVEVSA